MSEKPKIVRFRNLSAPLKWAAAGGIVYLGFIGLVALVYIVEALVLGY